MPRQELLKELELREKELMEELKAIRTILDSSRLGSPLEPGQNEIRSNNASSLTPKGKMSWEKYVVLVLREIGGKGKSKDVTSAIVEANPKIDDKTISHAVRHHLSKLQRNNIIGAKKGDVQSEGYEFFIK